MNIKKLLAIFLFVLLALPAFADMKTFLWDPVTQDLNGNPPNLTNYYLYISKTSGAYTSSERVAIVPPNVTTQAVAVGPGVFFAVVSAVNAAGESGKSNEVTFTVLSTTTTTSTSTTTTTTQPPRPKTPLNFKVQ